jgi:outer membrane lipopolysaccharide assembly protein LptE/RlpB
MGRMQAFHVRIRSLRALAAVALSALAGCGYSLVDERALVDPELRDIQMRTLENRTSEGGFEGLLADALREEFVRRGALEPVLSDGSTRAPYVLEGTVLGATVRSSAFSSVALTLEDQIEMVVSLEVARAAGDVVWQNPELRVAERFLASPDPQVYESNKEQALRRLAARMAQSVHDGLFQQLQFEKTRESSP